jgi:hypothetical protein
MGYTVLALIPDPIRSARIMPALETRLNPHFGEEGWAPHQDQDHMLPEPAGPDRRFPPYAPIIGPFNCAAAAAVRAWYPQAPDEFLPLAVLDAAGTLRWSSEFGTARWRAALDTLLTVPPDTLAILVDLLD